MRRREQRRRGRLLAVAVLALVLIGTACVTTPANLRARNRGRINQLSFGLSKAEVLAMVGTDSTWVCLGGPACLLLPMIYLEKATNPHRTELAQTPDGTEVEILFYQTETRLADGAIADDELTPIVFEDGHLVGWGWIFLRQNAERYAIELR